MFKELLSQDKYSKIKKYCESRDIENKNRLNLEELYFIPGISETIIDDFINDIKKLDDNLETNDITAIQNVDVMNVSLNQLNDLSNTFGKEDFIEVFKHFNEKVELIKEKIGITEFETKCNVGIGLLYKDVIKGDKFLAYCNSNGYKTVDDLKHFDFINSEVPGIGKVSLLKLKKKFEEFSFKFNAIDINKSIIRNVAQKNMFIQVKSLIDSGFPIDIYENYSLQGLNISDLENIEFTDEDYIEVYKFLETLSIPAQQKFYEISFESLKENFKRIFIERIKGRTLESIAQDEGITRERVRQICAKVSEQLHDDALLALDAIIIDDNKGIEVEQIKQIYNYECSSDILIAVCKTLNEYEFLEFSEKFVRKDVIPADYFISIDSKINEMIEEGIDVYELLDCLEENISNFRQGFFQYSDFVPYLLSKGFKLKGNFVTKGRMNISIIAHDAISKYFDFDIKLDSDELNEDLIKLRSIVKDYYAGFELPENNRALTAAVTRDSQYMILSGRGRYCPVEKVVIDKELLDEIYRYIINSDCNTFYYSDLFEIFKAKLLAESSVDNYNFLHGVLLLYYRDDLEFSRDYITKLGENRDLIDQSIVDLIVRKKQPISYRELLDLFPSLNKVRLTFIVDRNENLIHWGKNQYNVVSNLSGFDQNILNYLKDFVMKNNGYVSANQVYKSFERKYSKFLQKNGILDSCSLYYGLQEMYRHKLRFKFPHIVLTNYPVKNLNTFDIARHQLRFTNNFNWIQYSDFIEKVELQNSTMYSIMPILNDNYYKLSEVEFILKESFSISDDSLHRISMLVKSYTDRTGYYAIASIRDFDAYPDIGYEWNPFLLETIISKYFDEYKVLSPVVKDRRYQRGIIVKANLGLNSYDELVYNILIDDGKNEYTEIELFSLLSRKDLVYKKIPQDIITADFFKYRNERYILVK